MMPAMDSIAMTAMATPYRPESEYDMRMPATIVSTGGVVACIETARPVMMFVAWPVVDALAISWTGLNCVPVKYSVMITMSAVMTRPTSAHTHNRHTTNWPVPPMMASASPITCLVSGYSAIAASTAAIVRPVYIAAMMLVPRMRTNHEPMIEAMMDTPPIASGKSVDAIASAGCEPNTSEPNSIAAIVVTQ